MRLPLIAAMLLCSPVQAALINPLGGTWTDGTATADYVQVPPSTMSIEFEYTALLTIADNSHLMSRVWALGDAETMYLYVDNSVDFYDGSGELTGTFSINFADMGDALFPSNVNPVWEVLVNGESLVESQRRQRIEAGTYTLQWTVDSMLLNEEKRTVMRWSYVPEPSTVWLVSLLLMLFIWWRIG